MDPVTKSGHQSEDNPMQFVLSDESVDRMGDVIRADGWSLDHFKANPIALFGHDHSKIVGIWTDVKVVGKKLLGTLKLAAPGTSELVDTTRKLLEQRILKSVSVGFQPIESKARKGGEGFDFIKSALHEVSLVSVPANPNALAIAKALSPEVASILFAELSTKDGASLGQSTHSLETPNLDAARALTKDMGINR